METPSPLLFILLLLFSSLLTGVSTSLQRLGRWSVEQSFIKKPPLFFFPKSFRLFYGEKRWEGLLFSLNFTKSILLISYGISAYFFFYSLLRTPSLYHSFLIGALIICLSLAADVLTTLLAFKAPLLFYQLISPFVFLTIWLFSPLTIALYKLIKFFFPSSRLEKGVLPSFRIKDKILEILHESELTPYLDRNDQKLILSVVSYKERIAREVMVPRIDVYSLASDTTIQKAAEAFITEGYSRIPVYRDNIDEIVGVLHYKDLLPFYIQSSFPKDSALSINSPIEKLIKPVLYTPETKKISSLLQEFRSKQIHLAIVVDEYGGTEGIVTIEDILEELVGEIGDEYDPKEEHLFTALPGGGWIVDAKMSIIDIEEELGIRIPQSPEYDTIGGYIFHRAGAIPSKGWRIHHDEFDLEILSSNDRSIDKIRITPHEPAS